MKPHEDIQNFIKHQAWELFCCCIANDPFIDDEAVAQLALRCVRLTKIFTTIAKTEEFFDEYK